MKEDVFDSVDAIDMALDKEFGEVANETDNLDNDDEHTEDNNSVEETEETDSEATDEQDSQEVNEPETKSVKEDKVDKKEYAFANLRAENGNLKKERDAYKSDSDFLNELAQEYGYADTTSFQEALKQSRYQREAKEKGYDYELYKKTIEQEERIAKLEQQKSDEERDRRIERFGDALDNVSSKYDISKEEIFERLEDAGLTADEILSINNPTLLLNGVLADKIQAQAKQNHIEEIKNMKDLVEDDNEQNAQSKQITIESLLESDLAKYKADNFL